MSIPVGFILKERYRIEKLLGQGGYGAVYRAHDQSLDITVAIKTNENNSAEFTRQFEREARILARLRHPNLLRVSDHFFIDGQGQYLVMDFVEGKNLEQLGAKGLTPGYSPPEQYGQALTDARSDIYALGATLYTLLTKERPPNAIDRIVHNIPFIPPRRYNQTLSLAIEQAIFKAMESAPSKRFQTIEEFQQAITGNFETGFNPQCSNYTKLSADFKVEVNSPDEAIIQLDWTCRFYCNNGIRGYTPTPIPPTETPWPTPTEIPWPTPIPPTHTPQTTPTPSTWPTETPFYPISPLPPPSS